MADWPNIGSYWGNNVASVILGIWEEREDFIPGQPTEDPNTSLAVLRTGSAHVMCMCPSRCSALPWWQRSGNVHQKCSSLGLVHI